MIAIDTSSMIAYFEGVSGADVSAVDDALRLGQACLAPAVVAELFSGTLPPRVRTLVAELPRLELLAGFWERSGALRALLRSKRLRARLGDALIAQCSIDHEVPLVTRDRDFRHHVKLGGLRLAVPLRSGV